MAAATPKKVAIIIGSVRTVRIGPAVVDIIHNILKSSDISPAPELSILDIASFNLPILDELAMPAMVPPPFDTFQHEHSKKWSTAIAAFDGYIFVSPEYNKGIPGATKNAIDYLYHAWIGKPLLIITYGIQGGKTASASLKDVITCMKLKVVETRPQLVFKGEGMSEVMLAGGKGELGPETKKNWEDATTESGKDILKGYEELVELLNVTTPEIAKEAAA